MKRVTFLIYLSLFIGDIVMAQTGKTIPRGYQVADWYGFKTSAVTYTFDDNSAKQFTVAQPLFDKYDYKITFFVITNKISNWTNCINAGKKGHEIASHTVHHKKMSDMPVSEQESELKDSQDLIRSKTGTDGCQTMAYPNCTLSDRAVTEQYYIAARSCAGKIVPKTPVDFYRISSISTGIYSDSYIQTPEQFNVKVNAAKDAGGWCVFLTHCIDDEKGYSPTQSSSIARHLEYVHEHETDFWVASFVHVVKYIRERNALCITEVAIDANSCLITITDNLPDAIYNVPVTIRREMPFGWEDVTLTREGKQIPFTIVADEKKYIVFDAIPDSGNIILSKGGEMGVNNNCLTELPLAELNPNPFTERMTLFVKGHFDYSVFDLSGRMVEQGKGTDRTVIGCNLLSGIFILKVKQRDYAFETKIIKK